MVENPYKFPLHKCPYCGGGTIRVKQYIHGYGDYYVDLETGEMDCSELHSGLIYRNTGKYALCADCGKRLFKINDDLEVVE